MPGGRPKVTGSAAGSTKNKQGTASTTGSTADSDRSDSDEGGVSVKALVAALLDPRVVGAINKAMGPTIAKLIQDGIQSHLAPLIITVNAIKSDVTRIELEHVSLSSTV